LNNPKITIVTPSYNQAQYLDETIDSVLNQNYPNLEYFVVDGGSTDGSVEIIKKYEKHLTWWVSENDNGQTHAINKGFKRATGDIWTWLNSDDYFEPDTLQKVADIWKRKNGFNFLLGNVNLVDQKSKLIRQLKGNFGADDHIDLLSDSIYIPQPATFISKKMYQKYGLLDESFHYTMDAEFWIRLFINKESALYVDECFTNFRKHEETKSNSGPHNFYNELIIKLKKVIHDKESSYNSQQKEILSTLRNKYIEGYVNSLVKKKSLLGLRYFYEYLKIKPKVGIILAYTQFKFDLKRKYLKIINGNY
jgi:glycosyltransferase involved in cell wall biosynthesis